MDSTKTSVVLSQATQTIIQQAARETIGEVRPSHVLSVLLRALGSRDGVPEVSETTISQWVRMLDQREEFLNWLFEHNGTVY